MTTLNSLQAGADATNHRHLSQNHQLERNDHGRMIEDGTVPELVSAVLLFVEATYQYTAYPEGLVSEAVTIALQESRHELCRKYTRPKKHTSSSRALSHRGSLV